MKIQKINDFTAKNSVDLVADTAARNHCHSDGKKRRKLLSVLDKRDHDENDGDARNGNEKPSHSLEHTPADAGICRVAKLDKSFDKRTGLIRRKIIECNNLGYLVKNDRNGDYDERYRQHHLDTENIGATNAEESALGILAVFSKLPATNALAAVSRGNLDLVFAFFNGYA